MLSNPRDRRLIGDEAAAVYSRLVAEERVRTPLDTLAAHHRETYEHSLRVAQIGLEIGFADTIALRDLEVLGYASLLHDIGKVRIPVEILAKAASLADDERELMAAHTRFGFEHLEEFEDGFVSRVVVAHHEYKHAPYPRTGRERRQNGRNATDRRQPPHETVARLAQIVAIADMFDALAHPRAYKQPLAIPEIEAALRRQYTGAPRFVECVLTIHARESF